MREVFSVESQDFKVLKDESSGLCKCRGRLDGRTVMSAIPSADGATCVVLVDWMAFTGLRRENLFCVRRDGSVAWAATLPVIDEYPPACDHFVTARSIDGEIDANSGSCCHMRLDRTTGRTLMSRFVK